MPTTERVASGVSFTVAEAAPGSPLRRGDTGRLETPLGSGSYGQAYSCRIGGQVAAVKFASDDDGRDALRAEYETLVSLGGAGGHAPDPLGFGTVSAGATTSLALCEELCPGVTLRQLVERGLDYREPEVDAASTARVGMAIAEAVDAIGVRGVRHGDLSYRNVLVEPLGGGAWHCTIIDFGQAVDAGRPEVTAKRPGTVAFSAAEMFPDTTFARFKNQTSADAYSVGALMFYMRTWGRFEERERGSYFAQFRTMADGPRAIDDSKRSPLDLLGALRELGAEPAAGDVELGRIISELTDFDPRLRPAMPECIDRLARIAGTAGGTLALAHRLRMVRRGAGRAVARMSPVARRVGKVAVGLWVAYLTFAVCQAVYRDLILPGIREREIQEMREQDSALWQMVDDDFHADDQDDYDADTPGLREHNPALAMGHLDVSSYGSMTAFYDSDKYIASDGHDANMQMSYTDTREVLIVPFRDEWRQVAEPITWCENQLMFRVSARGGEEEFSYRYITPRPDEEIETAGWYADRATWVGGQLARESRYGMELYYRVGTRPSDVATGAGMVKELLCYTPRSETCILEARVQLHADGEALDSVSHDELLDDLLANVRIQSANLGEVSAASPYANLAIVSEDGSWQAVIAEDGDFKPYYPWGHSWYYHSLRAHTAMTYGEEFAYDFAPTMTAEEWLSQGDAGADYPVEEGELPGEDFTTRWSAVDTGDADKLRNLRVYVELGDSALAIEGEIPEGVDGAEVAMHLLLNTVEISRNQRHVLAVGSAKY